MPDKIEPGALLAVRKCSVCDCEIRDYADVMEGWANAVHAGPKCWGEGTSIPEIMPDGTVKGGELDGR